MKPKKPDRWEREAYEFFKHGGPFYAIEIAALLRKEHAAVVRMVQKELKVWSTPPKGSDYNVYGRACRAAQCQDILDQLKRRAM